ncbi:hypothetical protein SPSIL_044330 [Sporomusa silvacetica DSM 10669]|uniref:Uncharacterized protein n=1 Tax=Sporomusa silvacetica DSM 10669 TaxID=1123289 RepID=A0ABZ3IRV0_9FIRM|nr:hypothetical protein [Sporomusa silvacetica]OZC20694.1 NADH oxidase [Sporomusa silvacetica DSM 10669]
MTRHNYTVFSEGRISNLALKNRLVRSVTSENSMTTDGKATETTLKIYQNLAAGGSGMIIITSTSSRRKQRLVLKH